MNAARSPRRPAPAPDRSRHLRLVRGRPAPGRRPPARFLALAALGTLAALFLVVALNVLVGQAAVKRASLEERVRRQRTEADRLEVAVARLRSPTRVYERALELGLVRAGSVVVLDPSRPSPERE